MDLLKQLPQGLKDNISSLCIDGTSSTALLVDSRRGDILAPTKIYNEDQALRLLRLPRFAQIHIMLQTHLCSILTIYNWYQPTFTPARATLATGKAKATSFSIRNQL